MANADMPSSMSTTLLRCQRTVAVVLAVGLPHVAGCWGRAEPPLAPVTGKVTYKGKSLPHGQIVMVHDSGQTGASAIRSDGSYELKAQVGTNRVMIVCTNDPNFTNTDPTQGVPLRRYKSLIPTRYTDYHSSGLTIEVVAEPNCQDWVLSDKR